MNAGLCRKPLLLMLTSLLLAGWVAAETVEKITIKPKDKLPVREDIVMANLRMKVGDRFAQAALSQDIKRLFATNQFADIEVDVFRSSPGRVSIVYRIQSKPRVRDILFHGCDLISERKLRKLLTQPKRETLQEGKLSADLDAMHKKYTEKGYHGTTIRYFVVDSILYLKLVEKYLKARGEAMHSNKAAALFEDPGFYRDLKELIKAPYSSGNVHLLFWVFERKRFLTTSVNLEGAEATTIRKLKKTHPMRTNWAIFTGYADNEHLRDDIDQIRQWYWDHGYFDAEVTKVRKELGKTWILRRRKAVITFVVHEGKQYRVSSVRTEGNALFSREELERHIKLRPKKVYLKQDERATIAKIEKRYFRLGYLDFRIRAILDPNAKDKTVAITLKIIEGKPVRIRNVHISGNQITRDNVIRRELSIKPGDLGDRSKIDSSKSRLRSLRYFKTVETLTTETGDPDLRDLHVRVSEDDTGRFAASIAFSDVESALLKFEFGQSNFDIFGWDRGFRGGGQRFRATAGFGDGRRDFTVNFTEPWLFDRKLRYDVDVWRRSSSTYGDYRQDSLGGQMKLTKNLPFRYWRTYLGHRMEDIEISEIASDFSPEFIANEEGRWTVSAIMAGLIRDSRDRFMFATSGSRMQLTGEYHSPALGSYAEQYKINFRGDLYLPVLKTSVFRLSARLGHLVHLSGTEDSKIFDRYFAGGTGTLRGFEGREVSPVDPVNLEPIGGRSMMLCSAELLTPIFEDTLYGALFVDTGNVWAGSWDYAFDDLNVGAGFGVRIRLPIGAAISIDYGIPVVTRQLHLDDKPRVHFNLGYTF